MSETTPTTEAPAPTRRVKRRTWHLVIACMVVFVCGMVVGSGLTVVTAVKHIRQGIHNPQVRVDRWTRRIARRLSLDDAQRARLRPVIEASLTRFATIHRDIFPQLEAELDRLDQEVANILPSEKALKWREHFNHLREQWIVKPAPAE